MKRGPSGSLNWAPNARLDARLAVADDAVKINERRVRNPVQSRRLRQAIHSNGMLRISMRGRAASYGIETPTGRYAAEGVAPFDGRRRLDLRGVVSIHSRRARVPGPFVTLVRTVSYPCPTGIPMSLRDALCRRLDRDPTVVRSKRHRQVGDGVEFI
jgi:hypothetical protein